MRTRRIRGTVAAAAATASALVLASCSVTGGGGGGQASGSDTGPVTINALFMKQAGYTEDDVAKMVDGFQKDNPGITVKPAFVAYEALHDKIVTSAPAGTYDVVLIDVIWPAEFATKGIVQDVTDRIPAKWKDEMQGGAMASALYQDKFYGVPWYPSTKLFYYNADLLSKVGATEADIQTWDGVLSVAKKLKDAGVVKYPLSWSWAQAEALICDYAQILGSMGGNFTDDSGKLVVNKGPGVQALEWMKKTIDDGLTDPASTSMLEDDVNKAMASGSTAMALNWESTLRDLNDKSISQVVDQVHVMATPKGSSGDNPGVNGSMALSIGARSKHADAAWKFIEYISSQQVQDQFATSTMPNWKSSYQDANVTKTNPEVFKAAGVAYDSMIARPEVPNYTAVSQILQVEIQNALLGKKSPQQAMDDAVAQANALK
ncbi:extracellular solute-binding protein [Xylanimonas sp. McL0601]|uniref:extracellular solute-binding protein n=1 Tax=Xylanimonas sp. McL0601 TaxID=3414739 RepID=UPI003CF88B7F